MREHFFRSLPYSVILQVFRPSKSPHLGGIVWPYRLWLHSHGWHAHGDRTKSYWFHSGVLCPLECQGSCQSCSLLYPQNLVKYQEHCEAWQGDGGMILSLLPGPSFLLFNCLWRLAQMIQGRVGTRVLIVTLQIFLYLKSVEDSSFDLLGK